jgi:4-hydroxy-tetrahydrodipicolinate reductase
MALKLALIGYGKMGREIETIAHKRGHQVLIRVGREGLQAHDLTGVDAAIEFTQPDAAFNNVQSLLKLKIPTVSGTTGWFDQISELDSSETPLVYASNFSLGVNIAFKVNRYLAELMAPYPDYQVEIHETHHTAKKDAPSGTAITLAEGIIQAHPGLNGWELKPNSDVGKIPISATRLDPVPGTHQVSYESDVDQISLTHVAHSRTGFALGAVIAAERIQDLRHGSHSFESLLFG